MLTKDQIWKAADRKTVTVEVPEWNGSITFKTMTGLERSEWIQTAYELRDDEGKIKRFDLYSGNLIQLTAIDDKGALLFSPADVVELNKKDGLVLDRLFVATAQLNGILGGEVEKKSLPTTPKAPTGTA